MRELARKLISTPLHPQWLMPKGGVSQRIRECTGVVLDIGAASRWVESELASGAEYIAFDYPLTATGLYGTRPDVFGDARRLPFADASVQAVTCYEVLEHVREPDAVISEVSRVLAPGGFAEFSMPFLYPVHDAPHDYQRWTRYGWMRSANNAGLQVEMLTASGHPLHTAAVLAGLALAGPLQNATWLQRAWRLPLVGVLVPVINIAAWVLARLWPSWDAMPSGHRILLRRPT